MACTLPTSRPFQSFRQHEEGKVFPKPAVNYDTLISSSDYLPPTQMRIPGVPHGTSDARRLRMQTYGPKEESSVNTMRAHNMLSDETVETQLHGELGVTQFVPRKAYRPALVCHHDPRERTEALPHRTDPDRWDLSKLQEYQLKARLIGRPDIWNQDTGKVIEDLRSLFILADMNGDGVLQPNEFEHLLASSGFRFSPDAVRRIMDEADTNRDGVIQWVEFIPVMLAIMFKLYEDEHNQADGLRVITVESTRPSSSHIGLSACIGPPQWTAQLEVPTSVRGRDLDAVLDSLVPADMKPYRLVAGGEILEPETVVKNDVSTIYLAPKAWSRLRGHSTPLDSVPMALSVGFRDRYIPGQPEPQQHAVLRW